MESEYPSYWRVTALGFSVAVPVLVLQTSSSLLLRGAIQNKSVYDLITGTSKGEQPPFCGMT